MLDGGARDRTAQVDDLLGNRAWFTFVELAERNLTDPIEVGVISPKQLDEKGILRIEMVIQTSSENACGIAYLAHRCA